jgi:hypothetical protein
MRESLRVFTLRLSLTIANLDSLYQGRSIILHEANKGPCKRNLFDFMERFPTIVNQRNYYRCCRCLYPLAPWNRVISFTHRHDISSESSDCTHIFLSNPFEWMKSSIDTEIIGGQLFCPNCPESHCVGEYCWLGVQCQGEECAELLAPGLALFRKSKKPSDEHYSGVELFEQKQSRKRRN